MSWPEPSADETVVLRLFVTGTTTRSQRAITNIRAFCDRRLAGRCDLEVIDIYLDPDSTREFQIVATPTLIKLAPEPRRRIVGDLSNEPRILAFLDMVGTGGLSEARP
jgi:circadian clock protein KaiB